LSSCSQDPEVLIFSQDHDDLITDSQGTVLVSQKIEDKGDEEKELLENQELNGDKENRPPIDMTDKMEQMRSHCSRKQEMCSKEQEVIAQTERNENAATIGWRTCCVMLNSW